MTSEITPKSKELKISLSSEQLEGILKDFKNRTVSVYHQIRTPRHNPALDARRQDSEEKWAGMFKMLAADLYDYDPQKAVSFALRAATEDDEKNLQDKTYVMQLKKYRQNKNTITGKLANFNPLQKCGVELLEKFSEKDPEIIRTAAPTWFALRSRN